MLNKKLTEKVDELSIKVDSLLSSTVTLNSYILEALDPEIKDNRATLDEILKRLDSVHMEISDLGARRRVRSKRRRIAIPERKFYYR